MFCWGEEHIFSDTVHFLVVRKIRKIFCVHRKSFDLPGSVELMQPCEADRVEVQGRHHEWKSGIERCYSIGTVPVTNSGQLEFHRYVNIGGCQYP